MVILCEFEVSLSLPPFPLTIFLAYPSHVHMHSHGLPLLSRHQTHLFAIKESLEGDLGHKSSGRALHVFPVHSGKK